MQLPKPVTEEMGIERMAPLTHGELLGQMAKSTAAASASVSDVVSTGATSTAADGAGNGLSQAVGNNTAVNVRNEVSTGADTDLTQAMNNTADSPVRRKNVGLVKRIISTPKRILGGLRAKNDAAKESVKEKREEDTQG